MAEQNLSAGFHKAQAQLVVQTADLPLGTLAEMVESNAIDLQPGFQRRERWKAKKQSALIESFLLNVPVPPILGGIAVAGGIALLLAGGRR